MLSNNEMGNNLAQITIAQEINVFVNDIRPSILNKSSINTISFINSMISELPEQIPERTQKLDLTKNLLKQIPLTLGNIKELILNQNQIQRIPDEINGISSLKILRMNENKVMVIPFLKHIKHLQLNANPVKLITTKLKLTSIQFLSFDWTPFLNETSELQPTSRKSINYLLKIIESSVKMNQIQYVQFYTLFQCQQRKRLVQYIYYAIETKMDFFIQYLRDFHSDLNYNEILYKDNLLLQHALMAQNHKALQLFMLKRSNINKETFTSNLELACIYHNMELFEFIIGSSFKRLVMTQCEDRVIQSLLISFSKDEGSGKMLKKILKYCKYSKENKKIYEIPDNYNQQQCQCITQGIAYILNDEELRQIFDFNFLKQNLKLPLLHFGMKVRNSQMIKLVLKHSENPFQKNQKNKSARNIRGLAIGRKQIWKKQKQYIKDKIILRQEERKASEAKQMQKNKWVNFIFEPEPIKFNRNEDNIRSLMGRRLIMLQKTLKQTEKINILGKKNNFLMKKHLVERLKNEKESGGITQDYLINSQILKKYKTIQQNNTDTFYNELYEENLRKNNISAYEIFHQKLVSSRGHDYEQRQRPSVVLCNIPILCSEGTNEQKYEKQFDISDPFVEKRRQIVYKK